MKFPLHQFGRAAGVVLGTTWAQGTGICHSLGFNRALIPGIVWRIHEGAIFFP